MEDIAPGQTQKNSKTVKNISVSRRVQNAIRQCQGSKGVSYIDLKKYLIDSKKLDLAVHAPEIKLALKNGIDRGILTKESGLYKVKTAARRRRSRSPSKGRKGTRRKRSKSKGRSRSRRRKSPKGKASGRKRSRSRRRRRKTPAAEAEA